MKDVCSGNCLYFNDRSRSADLRRRYLTKSGSRFEEEP
jgi:hypothetical protein